MTGAMSAGAPAGPGAAGDARWTRELEIAREIQLGFLPGVLPAPPGWEVAAAFEPARLVSGDFYDAFPMADGMRLGVVVGDVCGKGVGAALFMALFRTLFRALAEQRFAADPPGAPPAAALLDVVTATNDYIGRTHSDANMFATVFFGVLDLAAGTLWYANGGHEAPVVLAADGGVRARLEVTGPAVGMMPDVAFGVAEVRVGPGEQLLAFTDGVVDARSPAGEAFLEERMLRCAASSPGAVLAAIQRGMADFCAGEPAFDDVTMLAVHRAAPP